MISESSSSKELPEELINKAICIHFVHTGRVYHKDELEKYWLVQFKKEYTNYVKKVIDLIIDRFNGNSE